MAFRRRLQKLPPMRKTFPLHHPRKAQGRVLDAIKHDIRNYVQRERRKPLPEGFSQWEFACKVGANSASAESVPLKQTSAALDRVAQTGANEAYVEIEALPAQRTRPDAPRRR